MGNAESQVQHQAAKQEEIEIVSACESGDVEKLEKLLGGTSSLIYSHAKTGENIWHFAANGGSIKVGKPFALYMQPH